MVKAEQVAGQQTEIVPHQEADSVTALPYPTAADVTTQGFLEMMSIIPTLMVLFFFMLMMGLMRDIVREPGAAKEIVVRGVEVGKEVVGGVAGAVRRK